jgi:hypothetical protein
MLSQVAATCSNQWDILLNILYSQWFASGNRRATAMHLESTNRGDDHGTFGFQPTLTTFDVEKL